MVKEVEYVTNYQKKKLGGGGGFAFTEVPKVLFKSSLGSLCSTSGKKHWISKTMGLFFISYTTITYFSIYLNAHPPPL